MEEDEAGLSANLQADAKKRDMVPAPYVPPAVPVNLNAATGEFLPIAQNPDECAAMPYKGIASLETTEAQKAILLEPVRDEEVEIRSHDGLIYVPHTQYRMRLTLAFGPGAWGIHPRSIGIRKAFDKQGKPFDRIAYDGALYIKGVFIAQAMGGQNCVGGNKAMSYDDAVEGAKSDCLVRCCKDLGMFHELWNPAYARWWVAEHAEKDREGKWHRKDASFTPPRDDAPDGHPVVEGSPAPPAPQKPAEEAPAAPTGQIWPAPVARIQDKADWWVQGKPDQAYYPTPPKGARCDRLVEIQGHESPWKDGKLHPTCYVVDSNTEELGIGVGTFVAPESQDEPTWMDVRSHGKKGKRQVIRLHTLRPVVDEAPAPQAPAEEPLPDLVKRCLEWGALDADGAPKLDAYLDLCKAHFGAVGPAVVEPSEQAGRAKLAEFLKACADAHAEAKGI